MTDAGFSADVVVVGGGVIGLCVAEQLVREGLSVTIIEKRDIAAGASAGNAAGFAFSEVMPMASAATIRSAIGWFFDPTGPFSVVLRDLPQTAGWLWRFAMAARRSRFERSLGTLAALMQMEQETLPELLAQTGLESMVRETGALYLYESKSALERDRAGWDLRRAHGTEFEELGGSALHDFQQGLSPRVNAAMHAPRFRMVTDPRTYCRALHAAVLASGAETRIASVERLEPTANGVALHGPDGLLGRADRVVLAAGPWSARLASALGDRVSLIGERGYNTTFPRSALPSLDRLMFFAADGFVISPVESGIRVGGASEIASLERAPNFERSRAMVRRAQQLVSALQASDGQEWMGIRPTTPDTLPVIGCSSASKRVVYAFGHGHLGLTLASSTAVLAADLVQERRPAVDIEPLAANRF